MTSTLPGLDLKIVSCPNFRVEYVIQYTLDSEDQNQVKTQFEKLIIALHAAGLAIQVRFADKKSLFIFVRVSSPKFLMREIYRSRLQDWLFEDGNLAPPKNMFKTFQENPITESERLRFVHTLITNPLAESGAGITPKCGDWNYVQCIFPLHDHSFNKLWAQKLRSKYFLNVGDLIEIKNHFGERIAIYFAFVQSYFLFLTLPAGVGFCAWALLGQYSPIYAAFNALWCIFFIEYWKIQQKQLADQWGAKGGLLSRRQRSEFQYERTIIDPVTGETLYIYSSLKRLLSQLLLIPFVVIASIFLGGLIATCFAIEIFISEIYDGPFKVYLEFLPTVILTTVMPVISTLLTGFASRLTDFENYQTVESHETSMLQKIFVLNFITSYLPIFLTAFVYVPFAQLLVPYINVFEFFIRSFANTGEDLVPQSPGFRINPDRLTKQVIYFTVTAQIVDFGLEVVAPYATRKVSSAFKQVHSKRITERDDEGAIPVDDPKESAFLARVRNEANLSKYDVTSDLREMVVQFGYLSLFSVVWPLTAISFLVNNWFEIRGDAIKLTMHTQRTVPWQADSIGHWIDALGFLSWLGSLTSAALVYLFSGNGIGPEGIPWSIKGWGILFTLFLSEHIYMASRIGIKKILSEFGDSGGRKDKSERIKTRLEYVRERLQQEGIENMQHQRDRSSSVDKGLEDNNYETNVQEDKEAAEDCFWQLQHDFSETIRIWKIYISNIPASEPKKKR